MHMSDANAVLRQMRLLWVVTPMAGPSAVPADVEEAIAFVASRGPAGIDQFGRELTELYKLTDVSGLSARLAGLLGGRLEIEPSKRDIWASVEAVAVSGRSYFATCMVDPSRLTYVEPLEFTFFEALAGRRAGVSPRRGPGGLKDIASLRRSGAPWISTMVGLGVGVRQDSDWPFRDIRFMARFERLAAIYSQSPEWLALRKLRGLREVDVNVEFWRDASQCPPDSVRRTAATRLEVFVAKPVPGVAPGSDAITLGDDVARSSLKRAFELIEGTSELP